MNDNLEAMAGKIGDDAAARLDVERTAQGVVRRLREQPAAASRLSVTWLRIAAAVGVLVGGGIAVRTALRAPAAPDHYVAEELGDLSADELRTLLSTLDETLTTPQADGVELEDLDAQQLREILRTLEG